MPLTLDASVVVAWALQDKRSDAAENLLLSVRRQGGVSPALLWFEIRNALIVAERRGRILAADTDRFLDDLEKLAIEIDFRCDSRNTLRLARIHNLAAYDAAYLEVAMRRQFPLATIDQKLAQAAKAEGVNVVSG
ncbi:MAG TPA: type II toxin-antitoxin system VapC family toxin [Terracidiphilus sp.]|nr:type II toxin-antitoxin system VapC family toxin [Terracidiphilus sp.]